MLGEILTLLSYFNSREMMIIQGPAIILDGFKRKIASIFINIYSSLLFFTKYNRCQSMKIKEKT